MKVESVFLLIADISGYTQFVTGHKFAMIHAEKIIIDLLNAVIDASHVPLKSYEIMGDAVSFYAIANEPLQMAEPIYRQVESFVKSFSLKESKLISGCKLCSCEACTNVEQLKLKVIMHAGEAVVSEMRDRVKLAGEDIILAHRLLKNSVPSDEYLLMTDRFFQLINPDGFTPSIERYPNIGSVKVWTRILDEQIPQPPQGFFHKIRGKISMERYVLSRMIKKSPRRNFRNLPD